MSSRATEERVVMMFCTPWAGMRSACRPRTRRWLQESTLRVGLEDNINAMRAELKALGFASGLEPRIRDVRSLLLPP